MKYSITRVFTQLLYHWKTYLALILEFAVGVAILTSSLNILLTNKEALQAQKDSIVGQPITVSYTTDHNSQLLPDEPFPVTYQDYLDLGKKYGEELGFSYTAFTHATLILKNSAPVLGKSTQFIDPYCFYMDDAMFQELFGYPREPGKAYAGNEALAGLQVVAANPKNMYSAKETNGDWLTVKAGGTVQILGQNDFQLTELKNPRNSVSIQLPFLYASEENSIPIGKCIIFPAETAKLFNEVPTEVKHSILTMKYKNSKFEVNVVPSLLSELSKRHPKYHFTVADKYLTMEATMDQSNENIVLLLWVSAAIMVIVMIGMIGVLLIFLYRRKKSMAIAMAFGSTFARLVLELLFEIFIVFELGSLLGLAAAYFITPLTNGIYAATVYHPVCIWLVSGITVVAAILATAVALIGNKKLSPIKILRDL